MLKTLLSPALVLRGGGGLPAATSAASGWEAEKAEEKGIWHYLVTDSSGIRPRAEPTYSKATKKCHVQKYDVGKIVTVDRRRRSGWTRWLHVADAEDDGWLFDVSPKDRRVRMIETEVQDGSWDYEVCVDLLAVFPRPHGPGCSPATASSLLRLGDEVEVCQRVRPLLGRGAFLRLASSSGWVLDFMNGRQTLLGKFQDAATGQEPCTPASPLSQKSVLSDACPEFGEWDYVVLDPQGITLRGKPTYDKRAKLPIRLQEGEVVCVVERRGGANTRFLRVGGLEISAWAFEQQPSASSVVRMMEVTVNEGLWFYQIVADKGCALRKRCSLSSACKAGQGPQLGAVVRVSRRVKVGSTTFLSLKDGSGWIFDVKDGQTIADGPLQMQYMREVPGRVTTADEGVPLLRSPTHEEWAKTNMIVLPNASVAINLKVRLGRELWVEISRSGGMTGWVLASQVEVENSLTSTPGRTRLEA